MVTLNIIYGGRGSGKSHYIRNNARMTDIIIDDLEIQNGHIRKTMDTPNTPYPSHLFEHLNFTMPKILRDSIAIAKILTRNPHYFAAHSILAVPRDQMNRAIQQGYTLPDNTDVYVAVPANHKKVTLTLYDLYEISKTINQYYDSRIQCKVIVVEHPNKRDIN